MARNGISSREGPLVDEDEIFKTLSHRIRRDIVKLVGADEKLTFSEIKNRLNSIDSPTLSYHLKSLQPLLIQEANKYKLSDIGEAALLLLTKTDQSIKISKYRRNFLYAYVITVACWLSAEIIVPWILGSYVDWIVYTPVHIIITAISTINMIIIWQLRKRYT
ncbi:MAG TPA: helix-turn-helix domain-containing protein [Candidatus Deferrimicrobium sp.]|nr:helix-turn-helix domain-containing protein [Candidatus Deferrimicrobium sp.]